MQISKSISWKRLAIETIAIVSGILLAFRIDAWYETVLQRDRGADHESRLAAELRNIRDAVSEFRLSVERSIAFADQAAPFFEGDGAEVDHGWLVSAIYNIGRDYQGAIDTSNFADLVSTGGMALISDADTRVAIQRAYASLSALERNRYPSRNEYLSGVRGWIPQALVEEIRASCPNTANHESVCEAADLDGPLVSSVVEKLTTDDARLSFQLRHQGLEYLAGQIERSLENIESALEIIG